MGNYCSSRLSILCSSSSRYYELCSRRRYARFKYRRLVFHKRPLKYVQSQPTPTEPSSSATTRFRDIDDILDTAIQSLCPLSSLSPDFASQESGPTHLSSPLKPPRESANAKGKGREDRPVEGRDILALGRLECVKLAVARVCDVKGMFFPSPPPSFFACMLVVERITRPARTHVPTEIAGHPFYRYSEPKLLALIRAKVDKLADPSVFGSFRVLQRGLARTGLLDVDEEMVTGHVGDAKGDGDGEKTSTKVDKSALAICTWSTYITFLVISDSSLRASSLGPRIIQWLDKRPRSTYWANTSHQTSSRSSIAHSSAL